MKYTLILACCLLSMHKMAAQTTCNFAGTLSLGTFIGQSNHAGPDTIFLCYGDSLLVKHNGDAVLTGDPLSATPAGIAFGMYACPPAISGPTLQDISAFSPGPGDPCLVFPEPGSSGINLTPGFPNGGETWLHNSGELQDQFNFNQPFQVYFAPITVDSWVDNQFEMPAIDALAGPCVNVNLDATLQTIYLNKVEAYQIDNHFGDDCLGKFKLGGGYPEYDFNAGYARDISLESDPSVKALMLTSELSNFHNQIVIFSISKPGNYIVTLEDGKSCGQQFAMDMSGCNPADNLIFDIDSITGAPGETICIPVRVKNFSVASGSLAFNWDATKLRFIDIDNLDTSISFFNPVTSLNTSQATNGKISLVIADVAAPGKTISTPDGSVLFELCMQVLDTLQRCGDIIINANPAPLFFENPGGQTMAVTALSGSGCSIGKQATATHEAQEMSGSLVPNPVKAGENVQLTFKSETSATGILKLRNVQGQIIREEKTAIMSGENRIQMSTADLAPGVYIAQLSNPGDKRSLTFKLLIH